MIRHIAFTVYPVTDIKAARRFYEEQLGLAVSANWDDKWVEYSPGEGVFAITSETVIGRPAADAGGTIAFEVDDVDALTATLRGHGVTVLVEPFATPVCRMSVVLDPAGNSVVLHHVTD